MKTITSLLNNLERGIKTQKPNIPGQRKVGFCVGLEWRSVGLVGCGSTPASSLIIFSKPLTDIIFTAPHSKIQNLKIKLGENRMEQKKCPLNSEKDCGDWCAWFKTTRLSGRPNDLKGCVLTFISMDLHMLSELSFSQRR